MEGWARRLPEVPSSSNGFMEVIFQVTDSIIAFFITVSQSYSTTTSGHSRFAVDAVDPFSVTGLF